MSYAASKENYTGGMAGQSLIPWVAMGASMGMGYFGLEALFSYLHQRQRQQSKPNPLQEQITRHMHQIGSLLSLSDTKRWLWKCWAFRFVYQDIIFGVVVASTPSTSVKQRDDNNSSHKSAGSGTSSSANRGVNLLETCGIPTQTQEEDYLGFLTLPPQLHLRLPPKPASKPAAQTQSQEPVKKERYLEMLLHNISHTDLVIGLDVLTPDNNDSQPPSSSSLKSMCLCRPRFSAFDMYCRKLLQALESTKETTSIAADIILVPQHKRSQDDGRYTILPSDNRPHIAAGFCWKTSETTKDEPSYSTARRTQQHKSNNTNPRNLSLADALADLRVRGKDMAKLDPYMQSERHIFSGIPAPPLHTNTDEAVNSPSSPTTSSWDLVGSAHDSSSAHTPKVTNYRTKTNAAAATAATPAATTTPKRSKENILVELKAIFFPVLAALLPRWHAQIADKFSGQWNSHEIHKVLVLVTGVGTPRNWTHSITGNSTQALADLMELFLAKVYPDITVVKLHSDTNIFRYDDNIIFVQQELLPQVNAYRDAHATFAPYPHELLGTQLQQPQLSLGGKKHTFDVDWKKTFAVTLSFADGSPARTHAIQTSLRMFRPTYFHMWQLKTFWHERKIVDDDVEVHSFEEMETSPAMESTDMQGDHFMVVQEMKAFRQEMYEILQDKEASSDLHSFWLRKTHKAVLAVLLVQSEGGPPVLYRGTNMEVSMPTGSLCAERNAISTALASNPKLKRQDLKFIAVLAVPPPSVNGNPPKVQRTASIGSSSDYYAGGGSKSSRHNSIDETKANIPKTMNGIDMRRQSFDEREEDWTVSYGSDGSQKSQNDKTEQATDLLDTDRQPQNPSTPMRTISLFSSESSNSLVEMIKQKPVGSSPSVAIPKSSTTAAAGAAGKEKRNVIVRSNNHDVDLNPLRPCGACHEWLKKIAECNPYFQIMTFTDADCNGVYCTPCQE